MAVHSTAVAGLLVVRSDTHGDDRGFFRQTYRVDELAEALGREPVLRQGNHSRSAAGTLRGFHAEPWDKLIYVVRGTAFCAIADTRPESPTFGVVETFTLGDEPGDRIRLFISEGLSNSFCSLTETDYVYDVTGYYTPRVDRRAVAWDDPDLAVDWPITDPLLSDADRCNPTLRERYPDHPRWA
jgi:dTDP-4-dehydrorhamnose 3,5-epimerase